MASKESTIELISSKMSGAGLITFKKMFGEYALYVNGKVIAFACDDSLFLKPTPEAKKFYSEYEEAPAYPGSKMYMLISEEKWEDSEFMSELASISFNALPSLDSHARRARRAAVKPKKPKKISSKK